MGTYDYTTFYRLFAPLIKKRANMQMIELNTNGRMPDSPFVAFDIVSPYIPSGFLEDNGYFEAVVSFTVYSKQKLDALNRANNLRHIMGDQKTQDAVNSLDIIIVERMPTQARAVQETTQFAYMYGFDLRVRAPYMDDDPDQIIDVGIEAEENNG